MDEKWARILIHQLVSAVAHIHSRRICHRDIKLQNILMENSNGFNAQIKLIDFGFSTRFSTSLMSTKCGTPYTTGEIEYMLICEKREYLSWLQPLWYSAWGAERELWRTLRCVEHWSCCVYTSLWLVSINKHSIIFIWWSLRVYFNRFVHFMDS